MRAEGIRAKSARKFKATTNSKHNHPVSENLMKQQFSSRRPNQKWVSDITYIRTREGWLCLAVVLALYSRAIVGWAMNKRMTTALVHEALLMSLWRRGTDLVLLLHSDRGSEYASLDYQRFLQQNGIV